MRVTLAAALVVVVVIAAPAAGAPASGNPCSLVTPKDAAAVLKAAVAPTHARHKARARPAPRTRP
jgi:hypothetical protein